MLLVVVLVIVCKDSCVCDRINQMKMCTAGNSVRA